MYTAWYTYIIIWLLLNEQLKINFYFYAKLVIKVQYHILLEFLSSSHTCMKDIIFLIDLV